MNTSETFSQPDRVAASLHIQCTSGNGYQFTLPEKLFAPALLAKNYIPLPSWIPSTDEDEVRFSLSLAHFTALAEEVLQGAVKSGSSSGVARELPEGLTLEGFAENISIHLQCWGRIFEDLTESRDRLSGMGYASAPSVQALVDRFHDRCDEYIRAHSVKSVSIDRDLIPESDLWEASCYDWSAQLVGHTVDALADSVAEYCVLRYWGKLDSQAITDSIALAYKEIAF